MTEKIKIENIYKIAEDNIVAREIHGEFLIIPIIAGVGDLEDEIFSLNKTGKEIWKSFDGKKPLKEIVKDLSKKYKAEKSEIEKDVIGLTRELLKRKMLIEVKKN